LEAGKLGSYKAGRQLGWEAGRLCRWKELQLERPEAKKAKIDTIL